MRASAERYRLDPRSIAGWGASAGAHLVSLLGLTNGMSEFEGEVGGNLEQSSTVQAVVDYFAVTDLVMLDQAPTSDRPTPGASSTRHAALLGYAPSDHPKEARRASPMGHVRGDAPPFLLLHGDADQMAPPEHSQKLHAALRAAGANAQLLMLPGAVHEDPAFWEPAVLDTVCAFLSRTLTPTPDRLDERSTRTDA